jgi:O-antigen/teichoic acid export membrane protein
MLAIFYVLFATSLFAVAIGVTFVLVHYVLGTEFRSALWPTALQLFASLAAGAGWLGTNYLLLVRAEQIAVYAHAIAALLFALICAWLVPKYSYWAATSAAAACALLAAILIAVAAYALCQRNSCTRASKRETSG